MTRWGFAGLLLAACLAQAGPVDRVKVMAGTSNSRWQLFPGATVPLGMVKMSPDNQGNVWNGGYEYSIASLSGFGPLHAFGLSGPSLMPVVGPLHSDPTSSRFHPGSPDGPFDGMWTAGWRARIDKASEQASPGYYGVQLVDYGVKAEVSASRRVGWLRLRYPASRESHLFIDFDPPAEEQTRLHAVRFKRTSAAEFEIHVRQHNGYAGTHDVHLLLQLSKPPSQVQTWQNGAYTGSDSNYGTAWRRPVEVKPLDGEFSGTASSGAVLSFATTADEVVTARVGLSFVSAEGARANLAAETASTGWHFDRVVAEARAQWAGLLGRIEVSDENPGRTDMLYTALYRAFAGKSLMNDVSGDYIDAQGQRARLQAPADAVYSSDALWGTQWNLTPFWTLVTPEVAASFANSLMALQARGGWIPQAPTNLRYSPVMVAQHQNTLLVSGVLKRLPGFDGERIYAAIRHDLSTPGTELPDGQYAGNRQLGPYLQHGYVPHEAGPSSNTFEYAYDDHCASQLAGFLGKADDAALFERRAQSWRQQIDPADAYARPRGADGRFVPYELSTYGTLGGWNGSGFVEGNAWTYSFWVPHDVAGLVQLMGRERFNERLERGFDEGRVDLANQPGLHAPFLFNHSGKPWLTQKWTRKIVAENFDTSPWRGWKGEEDEGQMTSYFVLLALGLFEIDGGCAKQPHYDLSSPAFRRIRLHLPGGKTLRIESEGRPGDVYLQSAHFNGRTLTRPAIAHDELVQGGVLRYLLGPQPNRRWGVGP